MEDLEEGIISNFKKDETSTDLIFDGGGVKIWIHKYTTSTHNLLY